MIINTINRTGSKIKNINDIKNAVRAALSKKSKKLDELNIIFMSDSEIKKINTRFLNHRRTTDVIAFDYSDEITPTKTADIFISVDTAKKNSKVYGLSFETEILILAVHGSLHIAGFDDRTVKEKKVMSEKTINIIKLLSVA
jgi:rRNA maturation RNase YbeY